MKKKLIQLACVMLVFNVATPDEAFAAKCKKYKPACATVKVKCKTGVWLRGNGANTSSRTCYGASTKKGPFSEIINNGHTKKTWYEMHSTKKKKKCVVVARKSKQVVGPLGGITTQNYVKYGLKEEVVGPVSKKCDIKRERIKTDKGGRYTGPAGGVTMSIADGVLATPTVSSTVFQPVEPAAGYEREGGFPPFH